MKGKKKLKLLLIILLCVLIILIGFVGIYTKKANQYVNKIPNYQFASDLKGATILELEVDDSINTIYYDQNGKEVDEADVTEENKADYTTKEEPINNQEDLTSQNYEKTLAIFKERLKFLKADQYSIDLDKTTGKMILTFEDDYPEDIQSILPMEGKLELKDTNTKDLILDGTAVTHATATYASDQQGNYVIYLNLKLTDDGIEKMNHIEAYKTSTDDNGEIKVNQFKVEFDQEEIEEVSYDDIVLTGKTLRITLAQNLTSNTEINSKLSTATVVSKLQNIGRVPVVYTITAEEYVNASQTMDFFLLVLLVIVGLAIIIIVYFILKYKENGLLASIAMVTNIALITIFIRLTNIILSLNILASIVGLIILNTYLMINLLKVFQENNKDKPVSEKIKEAYLKTMDLAIISLIIFVVFSFSSMTLISTMGLFFFWGWIIILLGNLLLTTTMLAIKNSN